MTVRRSRIARRGRTAKPARERARRHGTIARPPRHESPLVPRPGGRQTGGSRGGRPLRLLGWHVAFLVVFALGLAVSLALVAVLLRSGSTDEPATVARQLAILRGVPVLLNITLVLFGAAGTYVFYTYIAAFLESALGLTAAAASAFLTTVGVATIISNPSSGVIASRFGMESLAAGDKVTLRGPAGQPTPATVVRVTPSKIVVDADHELAGKALSFEIELVEAEGWS